MNASSGSWELISESPSVHAPFGDTSLITYSDYIERQLNARRGTTSEETQWHAEADLKLASFSQKNNPGYNMKHVFDSWVKNLCLPMPVRKLFELEKPNLDTVLHCDIQNYTAPDLTQKAEWAGVEEVNFHYFASHGFYKISSALWNLILSLTREKRNFKLVFHSQYSEKNSQLSERFSNLLPQFLNEWGLFCETKHVAFNGANRTKLVKFTGEKNTRDLRLANYNKETAISSSTDYMSFCGPEYPRVATASFSTSKSLSGQTIFSFSLKSIGIQPIKQPQVDAPLAGKEIFPETEEGLALQKKEDEGSLLSPCEMNGGETQNSTQSYVAICRSLLNDSASALLILHENQEGEKTASPAVSSESVPAPLLFNPREDGFHHIMIISERCEEPSIVSAIDGSKLNFQLYGNEAVVRVPQWKLAGEPDVFVHGVLEAVENRKNRIKHDINKSVEEKLQKEKKLIEENKEETVQEYLMNTVLPALQPAIDEVLAERPTDPLTVIAFRLLEYSNSLQHEGSKLSI